MIPICGEKLEVGMRTKRQSSLRHPFMGLPGAPDSRSYTLQASCHRCRDLSMSKKVQFECFRQVFPMIREPRRCPVSLPKVQQHDCAAIMKREPQSQKTLRS